MFDCNTVIGEATGGTGIGMLGILSNSLMWLLCSPNFTKFTLHLGIARTVEVSDGGAPSGDPGGDLCGEDIGSNIGGDARGPWSELQILLAIYITYIIYNFILHYYIYLIFILYLCIIYFL